MPGSSPRMLEKAAGIAVDEIVIDLEDAVIPAAKDAARDAAVAALRSWDGANVAVRVNAPLTPWCHLDLAAVAAVATPRLTSIVLPKVEGPGELDFAQRLLAGAEAHPGSRREKPLGIQALVETAGGLARVEEIAGSSCGRLEALILGYADLAASLGRSREVAADPRSWVAAQERLLIAARANDLQAIDGPFLGVDPGERFRLAAGHARALGFDGKWAIHPSQLDHLVEEFTPAPSEVVRAKAVLDSLERGATRSGAGAVELDGEMLDEAMARAARRILTRAGSTR